jgi:hypothetical protein
MEDVIGIYQITIKEDADAKAFRSFMKSEIFPTMNVGHQTRGGIVTGQYLVKEGINNYLWLVHWTNMGGSPFGSSGAPDDPKDRLTEFGAETSFNRYEVQEHEEAEQIM